VAASPLGFRVLTQARELGVYTILPWVVRRRLLSLASANAEGSMPSLALRLDWLPFDERIGPRDPSLTSRAALVLLLAIACPHSALIPSLACELDACFSRTGSFPTPGLV
jgi:hypothetical protein